MKTMRRRLHLFKHNSTRFKHDIYFFTANTFRSTIQLKVCSQLKILNVSVINMHRICKCTFGNNLVSVYF